MKEFSGGGVSGGGNLIVHVRNESQGTTSRGRGKQGDAGERKRSLHMSPEVHVLYFWPEVILSVPRVYSSNYSKGHVDIFIGLRFIDRNGAKTSWKAQEIGSHFHFSSG